MYEGSRLNKLLCVIIEGSAVERGSTSLNNGRATRFGLKGLTTCSRASCSRYSAQI